MSRCTVNLAFRILQPKIEKIQKIQPGTKNEGKWIDKKVLTSESMVDHTEQTSKEKIVVTKLNAKT